MQVIPHKSKRLSKVGFPLEDNFSAKFKYAQVLPINKKRETDLCSNCRPIFSLPIFSKLFENTMHNRVYPFLCKYKLVNFKQFVFRANGSTQYVLKSLIETIKHYLNKDFYSWGIFVDLQKSFGTVENKAT